MNHILAAILIVIAAVLIYSTMTITGVLSRSTEVSQRTEFILLLSVAVAVTLIVIAGNLV